MSNESVPQKQQDWMLSEFKPLIYLLLAVVESSYLTSLSFSASPVKWG